VPGAATATVALRVLRISRVCRLMKLLKSPLLRDLANILVSFWIALPALGSVLFIFLAIVYLVGILFRLIFGPAEGQDLLSECPDPDTLDDWEDQVCKIHYLYGEVYFGTVKKSMFTTFLFMLGNFDSAAGRSLAVAFANGYGDIFKCIFCVGMISNFFGLFNIITAVFVDSTISGLKHNEFKRKYARQYERAFVQGKLTTLVDRIQHVTCSHDAPRARDRVMMDIKTSKASQADVELTEEDFMRVIEDEAVKTLLEDLDVDIMNPTGLFDTFDPEGTGRITITEMVQAILRLRGDPQKTDLIASWVALRSLHQKFDRFQLTFLRAHEAQRASLGAPAERRFST